MKLPTEKTPRYWHKHGKINKACSAVRVQCNMIHWYCDSITRWQCMNACKQHLLSNHMWIQHRELLAIFLLSRPSATVSTSLRPQFFRVMPKSILEPLIRLGILLNIGVTWPMQTRCVLEHLDKFSDLPPKSSHHAPQWTTAAICFQTRSHDCVVPVSKIL